MLNSYFLLYNCKGLGLFLSIYLFILPAALFLLFSKFYRKTGVIYALAVLSELHSRKGALTAS